MERPYTEAIPAPPTSIRIKITLCANGIKIRNTDIITDIDTNVMILWSVLEK